MVYNHYLYQLKDYLDQLKDYSHVVFKHYPKPIKLSKPSPVKDSVSPLTAFQLPLLALSILREAGPQTTVRMSGRWQCWKVPPNHQVKEISCGSFGARNLKASRVTYPLIPCFCTNQKRNLEFQSQKSCCVCACMRACGWGGEACWGSQVGITSFFSIPTPVRSLVPFLNMLLVFPTGSYTVPICWVHPVAHSCWTPGPIVPFSSSQFTKYITLKIFSEQEDADSQQVVPSWFLALGTVGNLWPGSSPGPELCLPTMLLIQWMV